jgi:excisionase family DNA binding protein
MEKLMTVEQFADVICKPMSWVYAHLREVPAIKIGNHYRFSPEAVQAWLASNRVDA